jgi:hypothetical protein
MEIEARMEEKEHYPPFKPHDLVVAQALRIQQKLENFWERKTNQSKVKFPFQWILSKVKYSHKCKENVVVTFSFMDRF